MIKIIKPGIIIRDKLGIVHDARSTVTLIKNKKNIIVDTGAIGEHKGIINGLKKEKLKPEDIDIVINTHLHPDHCGNNDLFVNAEFIAHEVELMPKSKFTAVRDEYEIDEKVKIIWTPGHTLGSISVLVREDKRYAVVGDAIPTQENYLTWMPPHINIDSKMAMESMKKIKELADVVIPGHGDMFTIE